MIKKLYTRYFFHNFKPLVSTVFAINAFLRTTVFVAIQICVSLTIWSINPISTASIMIKIGIHIINPRGDSFPAPLMTVHILTEPSFLQLPGKKLHLN